MSEFKAMPKMASSEGSAVLKMAKGGMAKNGIIKNLTGKVKVVTADRGGNDKSVQKYKAGGPVMKAEGGAMGTLSDMAAMKMAKKRGDKKLMAGGLPTSVKPTATSSPMMMKKGGYAEGGETKAVHMAEMSKMKGLEKDLKSHKSKPASEGHKGLMKGGSAVKPAYKGGGSIGAASKIYSSSAVSMPHGDAPRATKATLNSGEAKYAKTLHKTTKGVESASLKDYGATSGVPKTRTGGYKTGGIVQKFAFGGPADLPQQTMTHKKGGEVKKYADGGKVGKDVTMGAQKMPQGKKAPSAPVRINQLAGTFKKGGMVEC